MNSNPKLLIGCAVYDDFLGLWPTFQSLRLYHSDVMNQIELAVIDNNPQGSNGQTIRDFVNWLKGDIREIHYVPYEGVVGTSAPRDALFKVGTAPAVLCIDSHVMLFPGAVKKLIQWYDNNPNTMDLFQGPMIYDDLKNYATHFTDVWGDDQMWGKWEGAWRTPKGTVFECRRREDNTAAFFTLLGNQPIDLSKEVEKRIDNTPWQWGQHLLKLMEYGCKPACSVEGELPFEIPAMGLGLFTCRREAWLGFNPAFRGFGGEEWYIHEKYRKKGHKAWCLPFLRWLHRFGRPNGAPFPLQLHHKARNYIIGLTELGISLERAKQSFVGSGRMSEEVWNGLIKDVQEGKEPIMVPSTPIQNQSQFQTQPQAKAGGCGVCGKPQGTPLDAKATLEGVFQQFSTNPSDINEHLVTLKQLASECEVVTEFAHRPDASTVALLSGQPKKFHCYGQSNHNTALSLVQIKGNTSYTFTHQDSLLLNEIEETDLLFIDTIPHDADRMYGELHKHGEKVRKWIVLHDTRVFGERSDTGGPGLLPAVRRYLQEHPEWSVKFHHHNNNGLMCLTKIKEEKKDLPPLWKQGWNVLKASWRAGENVLKDYGPLAGSEIQEKRLELCTLCESRNEDRCAECGCPVDKKSSWPKEFCPLGKWQQVEE